MGCDAVIAKTQSESLPPERGKVRMGVGLTRSQPPPSSPRLMMWCEAINGRNKGKY